MLEKAGQWQFRLKELQHRNQLPNKLLFAVDDSKEQDTPQYEAYTTALSLLENTGAVVLPITQQDAILEFASY